MKGFLFVFILLVAVMIAGCTASSPATTQATSPSATSSVTIPDLTGTWTGSMTGYVNGTGYVSYPAGSMTLVVENQTGRIFWGTMTFTDQQPAETTRFAGAINRDGKSFRLVNDNAGYDTDCIIVSENEIELIYTDDNDPFIITIDSLKRTG